MTKPSIAFPPKSDRRRQFQRSHVCRESKTDQARSKKENIMRSTGARILLALSLFAAFALASLTASADYGMATPASASPITAKQVDFQNAMRLLWEDHIAWTRLFIVDFAASSPELDATTARLLQNQVDIGDAIKPFYGEKAGDALTALLKDHILTAADVLTAAKAGDSAKVTEASNRWYANADQIAEFLSAANPAWPLADMKTMMKEHLDNTLAEAVAHLTGDWTADIAAYAKVEQEILMMADMLSAGIIQQFPDQFA
jgi:hypothetical protein